MQKEPIVKIEFDRQSGMEISERESDCFEVFYVWSGSFVHRIDGEREVLREGDFCFLPPGITQSREGGSSGKEIRWWVQPEVFTQTQMGGYLSHSGTIDDFFLDNIFNGNVSRYLIFHTGSDEKIPMLIRNMLDEAKIVDSHTQHVLVGLLVILIAQIERSQPGEVRAATARSVDSGILSIITENLSDISLEKLAKHLHYTVPYCSKYVKNMFGCTFSQLLQQLRFQRAEVLLQNSAITIAQISRELGYEDPENFMRAFKKRYGMTASQYRKQKQHNDGENFQVF